MWAIFHKSCLDGTGSAAAIAKKFQDVKLLPLSHSYTREELIEVINTKNDTIFIVDFTLRLEDFETILNNNNQVIHIDHHITIEKDIKYLKRYQNYKAVFDIKHSGAYLTWEYLLQDVPKLILYIEDRDIWKKEYPESDIICYYLFNKVLDDPHKLLSYIEKDINEIYKYGSEIYAYLQSNIQLTLEKLDPIWIKFGSFFKKYKVPALNSFFYQSELGHELAQKYEGIGCIFYITGDTVKLSFRSIEGTKLYAKDASLFFGGGGHLHAAGARIHINQFIKLIK